MNGWSQEGNSKPLLQLPVVIGLMGIENVRHPRFRHCQYVVSYMSDSPLMHCAVIRMCQLMMFVDDAGANASRPVSVC